MSQKFKRGDHVFFKGNEKYRPYKTYVWAFFAHLELAFYLIEHPKGESREVWMAAPPFEDGFESVHSSELQENIKYIQVDCGMDGETDELELIKTDPVIDDEDLCENEKQRAAKIDSNIKQSLRALIPDEEWILFRSCKIAKDQEAIFMHFASDIENGMGIIGMLLYTRPDIMKVFEELINDIKSEKAGQISEDDK